MPRKSSSASTEQAAVGQENGKRAVLDKAVSDILKRYGDGSIMRLGEIGTQTEVIPTGSITLDLTLGVGGIPRGRITEIYGPESSGKTTLCQHVVAEAQKQGGTAAYIDMEHALDPVYAARCGVDVENLLVSQPDTGEQALEIAETLVRSGWGAQGYAALKSIIDTAALTGATPFDTIQSLFGVPSLPLKV